MKSAKAGMTDKQLAEIRGRARRATPGPWEWPADHCDRFTIVAWSDGPEYGTPRDIRVCGDNREEWQVVADANFIVNAREDIPRLLAEIGRLKALLAAGQGQIQEDYEAEVADMARLLPAWFTERMMTDVWTFGLLLTTGQTLVIECIEAIHRDAAGTLWLDVRLLGEKLPVDWLKDCHPELRALASPTSRQKATVNASQVVAAFELADT